MTTRKTRSDSAASAVKVFQTAENDIQLPEGVELRSDEELVIWKQFTRARVKDAWRDFDLVLLAKSVRIEADIRKYQEMLDQAGAIIENQRGTPIENPLFRVIDTLQRQQLAIIRSMSLNQTGKDPRTLNDNAKAEKEALETIKRVGAQSLLAMPAKH